MMTLGSLFDGLGGWQLAAVRAGITPLWSSEIDKFCCRLTAKHFPNTKQLGDINEIDGGEIEPVEVITAGSPCQDLSIAGRREGIKGERSGLFFKAVDIVRRMRKRTNKPLYFIWENVTGIFSSNGGLDFRAVLEEIAETTIPLPKCGWTKAGVVDCRICQIAWRTFDAQYWGIAQRRQRIFLVTSFGKRRATEILFEPQSLSGYFEKSNDERERTSCSTERGIDYSIFDISHRSEVVRKMNADKVNCLNARMGTGGHNVPILVYGIGRDAFNQGKNGQFALSFNEELQPPLTVKGASGVFDGYYVRRLTPLECERLQGLPDYWTEGGSDAVRYKAIGNGMAQPIADWILKRVKG